MKTFLTVFFLLSILLVSAQNKLCRLNGKVVDEQGVPIPYTSIFIPQISKGAMANLEGEFSVSIPCGTYELKLQSMGYQGQNLQVDINRARELEIEMKTAIYELSEVVIDPSSEDPAYNIIRKATAMAEYYKEQIVAYKTKLYVRSFYDVEDLPWIAEKLAEEDDLAEMKTGDITETLLEYTYRRPNEVKEKILARKTGRIDTFKSGSSYINLNFYNLGGTDIVNPLSRGAFAVYKFEYQTSIFEENRKVHKIKVIPRRKGNDLMSGYLYINDGIWNINKVDVQFEQPMAGIEYKQIYNEVEPLVWMPTNHKIRAEISLMGLKMHVQYMATLSDIEVETDSLIDSRIKNNIKVKSHEASDSTYIENNLVERNLSKRQKEIEDLLQKEKLNKRETYKLVRMIKKESKEREEQDSVEKDLEISTMKKVEYTDSAFSLPDSVWQKERQIPLSEEEQDIYVARDSLNKVQTGDTVINKERSLIDNILFFDGGFQSKNKKWRFKPNGLLKEITPSFNTVDGWKLDKEIFSYEYNNYKKGTNLTLAPSLGYAFARETFTARLDFNGQYNPKKRAKFYGSIGRRTSDYNRDSALPDWINSISTLVFTENYKKLYQEDYFTLGHKIDLVNGLVLDMNVNYSERQPLRNYSTQKVFDFMDQEYTPNIPLKESVVEEPEIVGFNQAFNLETKVEYTPEYYYRFLGNKKHMLKSKYPTFGLTYRGGIPSIIESQADYHFLSFSIEQQTSYRLLDRIDYKLEAGKFLSSQKLFFADYKNFNTNPFYLMVNNRVNSFKLLDYYAYNSNDYYFEGHLSVENNHLLLKYLPLFNQTNWNEKAEFSYLFTEREKHYYEFGYSLNRIFLFMNVGAFVSFEDHQYNSFGVRIGVNLEDF